MRQLLVRIIRRFRASESTLRSGYFASAPSVQNALDIFQGEWHTTLPGELHGLRAGTIDLFEDPRISWALREMGEVAGKTVVELGPLEGAHTYMLEQAGCASITSIEGSPRAYLKCLVLKEILGLQRVHFLCGDFVEYLRGGPAKADAVIASGVLYHMTNPAELIDLISRMADRVFIWTHYYDERALAGRTDVRGKLSGRNETEYKGFRHALFRYEYGTSFGLKRFCGGPNPHAFWMERDAILDCLRYFGFNSIVTGFDEPDHPDGPAFAVVARK